MIEAIAAHIREQAAGWIIAVLLSGFTFAGGAMWFAFNLYTDIQLVKCKVGITHNNPRCEWTTTIVEDIEKSVPDQE